MPATKYDTKTRTNVYQCAQCQNHVIYNINDVAKRAHECLFTCTDCGDGENYATAEMLAWHRETSHATVASPIVYVAAIPSSNYHHVLTSARHVRRLQNTLGIHDDELLGCNIMPFAIGNSKIGGNSDPRPADFLALAHAMVSERDAQEVANDPNHVTSLDNTWFDTWLPSFLPWNKSMDVSMDNVRDVLASLCGDYSSTLGDNDPLARLARTVLRQLTRQIVSTSVAGAIYGASNEVSPSDPILQSRFIVYPVGEYPSVEFSDTVSMDVDESGDRFESENTDTSPPPSPPLLPLKSILRCPPADEPRAKRKCRRVEFDIPEKPFVFEYERDNTNYKFRAPSRIPADDSLSDIF